jgi:phosphatidate phosphatase APP1
MTRGYSLILFILLIGSSMVLTASSQEQVAQTVYVLEGDINGTMLSNVQVTGQDASGNGFQGITDSNGVVVINGQPGTWQFSFSKEGYNPLSLNYDVTETGEGAVYLQRTSQSQEQVAQTVYVHEGDLNGTMLSDVQVAGQDASGNGFQGITDSNGVVVINGQPGTWQFSFYKEGYNPLSLNYDVTETGEGGVYLQRT